VDCLKAKALTLTLSQRERGRRFVQIHDFAILVLSLWKRGL